jgi:hypothetical protein
VQCSSVVQGVAVSESEQKSVGCILSWKGHGETREREERERNEGGSANDDCEYNRGVSDDEYESHILDEELQYVDDS